MGYDTDFDGMFTLSREPTQLEVEIFDDITMVDHRAPDFDTLDVNRDYQLHILGADQRAVHCEWVLSKNQGRYYIRYSGGEKFYAYVEWLEFLIRHWLKPWGIELRGSVRYYGEDAEDRGVIYAKGYQVKQVRDQIISPQPQWDE
jgi:hypothetical protein